MAGNNGLFTLGVEESQGVADRFKIATDKSDELFPTVLQVTKSLLKCDDKTGMACVATRLPRDAGHCERSDAIWGIEEAHEFLAPSDIKEVADKKTQAKLRKTRLRTFAQQYREYKQSIKAKPKLSGAAMKKWKAKRPRLPKEFGHLSQADMNKRMPPNSYIWQSRGKAWHSKVHPFSETCRAWSKYGQDESCALVIKSAWEHSMMFNAIPFDECPIAGIFD